jgi:hypothetical protein
MDDLTPEELARLRRWQLRMVVLFVLGMVGLFGLFAADMVFGLSEVVATWAFVSLVALSIVAGFVQFSERCPRCGYRIGFQSRLVVPEACKKCGARLK